MTSRRRWGTALVACVVAVSLAGCNSKKSTSGSAGGDGRPVGDTKAPSSSAAPAPAAKLTVTPANGAKNVNPAAAVSVQTDGTLDSVVLKNDEGKVVKGALSADRKTWTSAEELGYSKNYTMTSKAVNADGKPVSAASKFSTVVPDNFTMPYLNTTAGTSIAQGATYGVGMVIVVHFDEQITDKKAAEKALTVTTSPAVKGAWYWMDDQNAHWRPEKYWAKGTKVTVAAKVYGQQLAPGLYGQADVSTSFKIGASHISIADDNTKVVKVYSDGKLVRSMPTSMGMGGYYTVKGNTLSFWTQPGTYTVLDQGNPVVMDSETYGLPRTDPRGYKENVYWATRISTDGVYVHSAPWSVWAQGNTDTSHGCLNVSPDNAQWFYGFSQPGDVVQVKNTGGSPLAVWQNGDWGVSWKDWQAGSAR